MLDLPNPVWPDRIKILQRFYAIFKHSDWMLKISTNQNA